MTPESVLEEYWGFDSFRPVQKDIILSVLQKHDTLAIMPTGGGKSICFQIPGIIQPGVCIVVTPLIALIKDQVEQLRKKGIKAGSVHSGYRFKEVKSSFEKAANGEFKFLYLSPERLETNLFKEYLPFLDVSLIAVDEAHCISQWGYDFRPSYLRIAQIRETIPDVPVIALTATATPRVQKDICDKLEFKDDFNLFKRSYERPNLSFSVLHPAAKENKIIDILNKVPGTSIAYCRSRRRTKELSEILNHNGISSDFYHAGLNTDDRSKKQDDWIKNNTRIICSTNAFGMGIDKPDVRSVIHFDMPDALENYYQEAGRAGRDGKKSYAVLLLGGHNIEDAREKINLKFPDVDTIRHFYGALCNYLQLPAGKGRGLTFDFHIGDFSKKHHFNSLTTVGCLKILEQEEILLLNDGFFSLSTVEFFSSKEGLEDFERDFPKFNPIIKGLLRSYEGIFDQSCFIDEYLLAQFIRMPKEKIIALLKELDHLGIIDYIPKSESPQILFLNNRVPVTDLIINKKNILERKAAYQARLEAMVQYATQKEVCRSVFINQYFGGDPIPPCGICDTCIAHKKGKLSTHEVKKVVDILKEKHIIKTPELAKLAGISVNKTEEALLFLVGENSITVSEEDTVYYKK